jgi:membrane-associated phospholipid phosphatase
LVPLGGLAVSPLDAATLAYAAVAGTVLALRWAAVPERGLIALAHGLIVLVVLLAPRARRSGGLARVLGELYPLLIVFSLYSTVGLLNRAGGLSHDARVQGWEQALFGGQPSMEWIRAQPWPWLSFMMHAAYLCYYPILLGAPIGLWLAGRAESARRALLLEMATFYACYVAFLLFPVAGPRYTLPLAHNEATRTAIARLTQQLLNAGSAWGTAFPSSHVAVALVASGCVLRVSRGAGVPMLAAATLLTLGTVYGQFHYGVDALAGAAVAAVVLALDRGGVGRAAP